MSRAPSPQRIDAEAALRRLRLFVVLLATVVLTGLLPGAALLAIEPADDDAEEPAPLPPRIAERPGLVRVRVRDEEGRAIPGAIARALFVDDGKIYLAGRASSDAGGLATLDALPIGTHWLIVEARGRARASTQRFVGADPIDLELRLGAGRALDVEVRDELGRPIAAAELEIHGADPLARGARTGVDGVAHPTGVGDGPLEILARATGFDEARVGVGAGEHRARVVLHRLGALVVTVVDLAGAPVGGATVAIAGGALGVPRTTVTGADGTARIGGLGAGSYDLRASQGGRVAPVEIGLALRRGEEGRARLVLDAGRDLRAHVVDELGHPLAGASLILVEGGLSPFPIEATTDALGDATLGPIPRSTPAAIGARARDFVARGPIEIPPGDGTEPRLEIVLRRAATLVGDVRDAQGRPIDGATIEIVGTDLDGLPVDLTPASLAFSAALFQRSAAGPRTLLSIGELGVVPGPVPPIPHAFASASGSAPSMQPGVDPWVTRGDGSFRATPLPAGRLRALVRHPAYVEALSAPVMIAAGDEGRASIVLAAGGRLEGVVRDEQGHVVDGAFVEVAARAGSLARGVRTASDGTFVLAAVPAEVTITLASPDRPFEVAVRSEASVPEGGTARIELVLPSPRAALVVAVTDDRRYPLIGAQITVSSLDPAQPIKTTAFTDEHGEATIARVVGLRAQLEVRAPGHAPERRVVESLGARAEVELAQGIAVKGVVYSPGGRAWLAGAQVTLASDAGLRRTQTDKDGRFAFDDVSRGAATLEVSAPGAASLRESVAIVPTGSLPEVDLGRLELGAAGTVEGTVVDDRGHPVAGARVARDRAPTFVPTSGPIAGVAITDASGDFVLADVAVGDAELEAYAADVGRGRSASIRVDEGRTTSHVRIVLQPGESAAVEELAPGGVAITLAFTDGHLIVAAVVKGSEAERAGLVAGDELVAVDGVEVITLAGARTRLGGPLGADVIVRTRRMGELRDVRVVREATQR